MSRFDKTISAIYENDYTQKTALTDFILQRIKPGSELEREDFETLTSFVRGQITFLDRTFSSIKNFKEKQQCEQYALRILALGFKLYKSKEGIPEDLRSQFDSLSLYFDVLTDIETAFREAFFEKPTEADFKKIIKLAESTSDEYQRGKFMSGLLAQRARYNLIDEESFAVITDYINGELERFLAVANPSSDVTGIWETAADLAVDFHNGTTVDLLKKTLNTENSGILFSTFKTLLELAEEVPDETVKKLASLPEYASITYFTLSQFSRLSQYPEELASNEYLAKSDLLQWHMAPSELGKMPDEILLLGIYKKPLSKEVYYIFKFRSESTKLPYEKKRKWLVGWSSEMYGPHSGYDLLAGLVKETDKKTLKNIYKELIY